MTRSLRLIAAAALIASAASLTGATPEATEAPGFELKDTDGKVHKLSDYEGKIVVLEWTNRQCPFVKLHYKPGNMQKLAKTYMDKGVIWLAVDSSNFAKADELAAVRKEWDMPQPVLVDASGEVGKAYGARTTPHMFIINDGHIVYQGALDDYMSNDKKITRNHVAAALDELLAGKEVSQASTKPYGCGVKYSK